MGESKPKHVDQHLFGFKLSDGNCKDMFDILTFHPKMKVVNIVLRWKVPTRPPKENDIDPGQTLSDLSQATPDPAPLISPCFVAGKDACPSNWRIHILTNHCEDQERKLSVFLEFYEYLEKDQFPPSKMNAIYIMRLLDPDGNILISRRSGIRYFNTERLCYGWKPFVSLKSVENLLESGQLRVEVDLTILRCQNIDEQEIFPEMEDKLNEQMTILSLGTEEHETETELIEWTSISCDDKELPDGNKEMFIGKSGFFKNNWDQMLYTQGDKPVLKLSPTHANDLVMMADVIHFINGNVKECTYLLSNNFDKLEHLYMLSLPLRYDIPSLKFASFNAMCHLAHLKIDEAVSLGIRASKEAHNTASECKQSMALLRNFLQRNILQLRNNQLVKDNQDSVLCIAELLELTHTI